MRTIISLLALFLCGAILQADTGTTPPQGIRDKTPQHIAFTHATIVVSPGQSLEDATLVIKDGLISAVGTDVSVPDGAVEIDLGGKLIYPGFVDPFTQYGLKHVGDLYDKKRSSRPQYEGDRTGAVAWNQAIHPEIDWISEFKPDSDAAEKWMELGFTVVHSAKQDGIMRGRGFVALLGDGLPNDLTLVPRTVQVASFDKGSSRQAYPSSLMGSIALLRQTFLDADWYRQARAAYEENPRQDMPEFNRSIAAVGEYGNGTFIFETEDELSLLRAERIADEFDLNFIHVGSNYEYARLEQIKAVGGPIILPLDYPELPQVKSAEDELDITLAAMRHWERAQTNVRTLLDAGIDVAFTTHRLDKAEDIYDGIRMAMDYGLTGAEALRALTLVPAQICGVADQVGTLENGKLANFFITDRTVFDEDVTVYSTWVAGKKHQFVSLDQTDFRDTYAFEMGPLTGKLKIGGKVARLNGALSSDTLKTRLRNFSTERDKIFFTAIMEKFGFDGVVRFAGRIEDGVLHGVASLPDGDEQRWTARSEATPPEEEEPAEAESDDDESYDESDRSEPLQVVSRLTYPNMAFGFEQLPSQEDVLITNATVWTCEDDGVLENTDILVRGGEFVQIGADLAVPGDVRVIDAAGRHVTPGLIDEHSHIAISQGVNEGTHAVTAEVRIGDVINSDDINMYRAIAGGTTIVQCLHGSANPIGGQAQVIKLRWGSPPEELKMTEAPPSIKFALGENVKQSNWGEEYTIRYPQTRMGVKTIMKDAFIAARENADAWQAFNDMGGRQRDQTVPPRRSLQYEALYDILNSRMFIHCHSYVQSEILMLMRLAEELGFTVTNFTHILEGYKVAPEMAAHGTSGGSFSDWWAYKFEVYDAIPYNTCIMSDKGVLTSVNSDSPELGRRLNQEAAKSVQYCGITPHEALKFVTINPAKQLKIEDYVGSIKVGKHADFVIWNGDPMSIYSRPDQTWIEGKLYFDRDRDLQMRDEIENERNAMVQKILQEQTRKQRERRQKYLRYMGDRSTVWECEDIFDVWKVDRDQKGGAR